MVFLILFFVRTLEGYTVTYEGPNEVYLKLNFTENLYLDVITSSNLKQDHGFYKKSIKY